MYSMKKILFLLILILTTLQPALYAQSLEQIIKRFEQKKGAELMRIPGAMMKLATAFMDDDDEDLNPEAKEFIKRINSMTMLDMEQCSQTHKDEFAQTMKSIEIDGYESLSTNAEMQNKARIFFHKGDKKNEMIMVIFDGESYGITHMKGRFDKESAMVYATTQQDDDQKQEGK